MSANIRTRSAAEVNVEEFVKLSISQKLPDRVCNAVHVKWKHLRSPFGASTAIDLVEKEEVFGRLWVTYRHWKLNNELLLMGHPQDLLVDTRNRALKDVVGLIECAFSKSLSESGMMYHGANPNSEGLYGRIFRSRPNFHLQASVFPVSPLLLVFNLVTKSGGNSPSIFDLAYRQILRAINWMFRGTRLLRDLESINDLENIFRRFNESEAFSAVRSKEYFDWRFSQDATSPYVVKCICVRGEIVGYVVWSDTSAYDIRARVLIDIVWLEKKSPINRFRLWISIADYSNKNVDLIVFISNQNNPALRKVSSMPMIIIPKKMMPQAIPIYLRLDQSRIDGNPAFIENQFRKSYFTLSDLDFF
jgi:hypothetical protein